jgi:hypothetical protein
VTRGRIETPAVAVFGVEVLWRGGSVVFCGGELQSTFVEGRCWGEEQKEKRVIPGAEGEEIDSLAAFSVLAFLVVDTCSYCSSSTFPWHRHM